MLEKLKALFERENVAYEYIEHEPTITCEDAARVRGTNPDQGAKALVCLADKEPVLIVLPCSRKLDFKGFKKVFGVKDLRMATHEQVKRLTTLEIGSIPPVGNVMGLPTYVEEQLLSEEKLCFNAGDHSKSMTISADDYLRVVEPKRGAFTLVK